MGRRLVSAIASAARRPGRWWNLLDPAERILYRAVVLLGAGFALVWPPLGLIVPGALFAAVFFGFSLRRAA